MVRLLVLSIIAGISLSSLAQVDCPPSKKNGTDLANELNKNLPEKICSSVVSDKKNQNIETLPKIIYGVFSASSKMKDLFKLLGDKIAAGNQKDFHCPDGCNKSILPIVEIQTKPTSTSFDPQCPKEYTKVALLPEDVAKFNVGLSERGIKKMIKMNKSANSCQDEATKFSQETLMGSNDFGKFLEAQKCLSPCSYSSSVKIKTVQTIEGSCAVEVELNLQCGPPKKEREWETTAIFQQVFRCEATSWKK